MRLTPRKRLMVDPKVQGADAACRGVLVFLGDRDQPDSAGLEGRDGSPAPFWSYFRFDLLWQEHGMVAIAAMLLLPVMLVDVMSTSNKFAGPVYRMRHRCGLWPTVSTWRRSTSVRATSGLIWPMSSMRFRRTSRG